MTRRPDHPREGPRWQRIPDPRPTPEEALIRAEEGGAEHADDPLDEKLERVLEELEPEDGDIADMFWRRKKNQDDIGAILGMSQYGVSYRLAKIRKKVWWLDGPRRMFTPEELHAALVRIRAPRPERVTTYWLTTSYAETARRHGLLSPYGVRKDVSAAIERLNASTADHWRFATGLHACRTIGHGLGTQFQSGPRRVASTPANEPSAPPRLHRRSPAFARE